jgi:hypothetical protein
MRAVLAVLFALAAMGRAFAGWLVQRDLSENILVGAELYYEGPQFAGDRYSTFYDAGGCRVTVTRA